LCFLKELELLISPPTSSRFSTRTGFKILVSSLSKTIAMKKVTFILIGLFFMCTVAGINNAFSFSINKIVTTPYALQYLKGSEFIKLSFKEFASLTGEKENLRNNLSFSIMKMRIRHDLKKDQGLSITDYTSNRSKHRLSVGLWIIIGIVALILIIRIIAGPFN
jgi:hypothetical protein